MDNKFKLAIETRLKETGIIEESDEVLLEQDFHEDFGMDSLDMYEMAMYLEDEFGININESKITSLPTVREVIEYLEELDK